MANKVQMTHAELSRLTAYQTDPLLAASVELIDSPFVQSRVDGEFDVEEWRINRRRDQRLDMVVADLRKRNHAGS